MYVYIYIYIYIYIYMYYNIHIAFFVYDIYRRERLSISRGRVTLTKDSSLAQALSLCLSVSLSLCLSVSLSLICYIDEGEQAPRVY
jgi:hypothetical protein